MFLLKALVVFASAKGIDTGAILRETEIGAPLLEEEQARVPIAVLDAVWDRISKALNDPLLGLHFGEKFAAHGEGHFLFAVMKNSETLGKAVESLIRFHNLITDMVRPLMSVVNGQAVISLTSDMDDAPAIRHVSDAVLGVLATVLRRITEDEIRFDRIEIAHQGKGAGQEYTRVLGIAPIFASGKNRILFAESELDRTFPMAQKEFGRELQAYAAKLLQRSHRSNTLSDSVLLLLQKSILKGADFSLGATAYRFNMSVRSFQALLKAEATNFQSLLDKARKEIASHYLLQNETMLCDIAFLLGYSEQSSFNHAFKKWTGLTPREYRKKFA